MKKFLYLIPFFILNSCIDFADDDPYDLGRKIENNINPTINSETLTIDLKPNETKKSVFRSSKANTNTDQMTYINKVKINVIHFDRS